MFIYHKDFIFLVSVPGWIKSALPHFLFRMIVEEYEKTISEVISEREREKVVHEIEKDKLASQRDRVIDDLKSVERAFNDVHRFA